MARTRRVEVEQEPVGIVISTGARYEETPRIVAYVWGPVPAEELAEAEAILAA
jgi:hypothetical protein